MTDYTSKILTISVAAYNMEAYIRETLDSLIDERIIDDLEVFVIDDGGTDGSLEIAREYAAMYPDSIFPIHKQNGGYGTTVNYSIAHSTGKYFKLLDGDDWFDREGLFRLVMELKNHDEELIVTPFYKCYPDKKRKRVDVFKTNRGESVLVDDMKDLIAMWSITYKTQILKSAKMVLPPHMLYTDKLYSTIPLAYCKHAYCLNCCVYFYRLGRDGQSVSKENIIKHCKDSFMVVEMMCNFFEIENKEKKANLNYLLRRVGASYANALKTYLYMPISNKSLQQIKDSENLMEKSIQKYMTKLKPLVKWVLSCFP